ncbi:hypothetical protein P2318_04490 [Myxococcaceae bacterium GXIMD 01537]
MRRSNMLLAGLSILLTGAVARAGEMLPALAVEARFACAPRQPLKLDLIEDMRVLVEVPAGCPDAGTRFLVSLACPPKKQCRGSAFMRDYVVAYLQGSRASLRPTNLQAEAPQALKQLSLRVTGTTQVELDESLVHHRAVIVSLAHKEQRMSYRLAPGAAALARFQGTNRRPVSLALQVDRSKRDKAHLRLVMDSGKLLLDEEMALGTERELDCATAGLACIGPIRLALNDSVAPVSTASLETP